MILHGPVSPKRATPKGQGRANQPMASKLRGRDDRSGDAGCTHTNSVGPERPRNSLSCPIAGDHLVNPG